MVVDALTKFAGPWRDMFRERIGDPTSESGREHLRRQSPVSSVLEIRAPLLVRQGANDPRVKPADTDRLIVALRDNGIPIEYLGIQFNPVINDNPTGTPPLVSLSLAGFDCCGNTRGKLATRHVAELLRSNGSPHFSRLRRHRDICLRLCLPTLSTKPRHEGGYPISRQSMRVPEMWSQRGCAGEATRYPVTGRRAT